MPRFGEGGRWAQGEKSFAENDWIGHTLAIGTARA
jgi:hypothetical protein